MNLDVNTLFLVTIYVEAVLGLLLLFAWVQNTSIHGVAWWGAAHLLRAASITLFGMYGEIPDILSIDLANAVLLGSFAVTWTGARIFDGGKPAPVGLVAGAALWLLASRMPPFSDVMALRTLLSAGIIAAYIWLTAAEFWGGRAEPLVSRLPAIFMLFAHGALFLLRTPLSMLLPVAPSNPVFGSVLFTVLSSEALLFTISIAFIMLAMAKERTELCQRTAALIDPLTGIANRRGFLAQCERASERQRENPQTVAVLLMDLDHFKSVNDRFGHAVGDRVLRVFAEVAANTVRPSDFVGRIGGEEFAAVLCNIGGERAMVLCERIRAGFAEASGQLDGCAIGATVSIGLIMSDAADLDIPDLLAQADAALYEAKARGRNRVEVARSDLPLIRGEGGLARPLAHSAA